ncbi:ISAs1 family transposase [Hahella sp. HN01]|uniref:ISAs1 family transposase n=1 Tax=Hahella sp. HN01 TaxID=2847262 RepID=UPI001C1F1041|nr:ISAs1 family transposase [Hahella sp. HN01]
MPDDQIAIDGKTLRRSYDRSSSKPAIHMVSAWSTANELVLGQVKTQEKSNEITAIPKLLKALSLKGSLVTLGALRMKSGAAAFQRIWRAWKSYKVAGKT